MQARVQRPTLTVVPGLAVIKAVGVCAGGERGAHGGELGLERVGEQRLTMEGTLPPGLFALGGLWWGGGLPGLIRLARSLPRELFAGANVVAFAACVDHL